MTIRFFSIAEIMIQARTNNPEMNRVPPLQFFARPNYMAVQAIVDNICWGYYIYFGKPHIYQRVEYSIGIHFIPENVWLFTNHPNHAENLLQECFFLYIMEEQNKLETNPTTNN